MNLMQGNTISIDYPPGLKPWDGRFLKEDRPADIVVLVLSEDGREAWEYAFNFYGDLPEGGFEVVGRRDRVLVSPKRARWAPFAVPYQYRPLVPYLVLQAAFQANVARMKAVLEELKSAQAAQDAAAKEG